MNSLEVLEKAKKIEITWKKRTTFYPGDIFSFTLKNELIEQLENDLKALELIKKKQVNVTRLTLVLSNFEDWSLNSKLKWYNGDAWFSEENFLELDEFIFLKDWLGRE